MSHLSSIREIQQEAARFGNRLQNGPHLSILPSALGFFRATFELRVLQRVLGSNALHIPTFGQDLVTLAQVVDLIESDWPVDRWTR